MGPVPWRRGGIPSAKPDIPRKKPVPTQRWLEVAPWRGPAMPLQPGHFPDAARSLDAPGRPASSRAGVLTEVLNISNLVALPTNTSYLSHVPGWVGQPPPPLRRDTHSIMSASWADCCTYPLQIRHNPADGAEEGGRWEFPSTASSPTKPDSSPPYPMQTFFDGLSALWHFPGHQVCHPIQDSRCLCGVLSLRGTQAGCNLLQIRPLIPAQRRALASST